LPSHKGGREGGGGVGGDIAQMDVHPTDCGDPSAASNRACGMMVSLGARGGGVYDEAVHNVVIAAQSEADRSALLSCEAQMQAVPAEKHKCTAVLRYCGSTAATLLQRCTPVHSTDRSALRSRHHTVVKWSALSIQAHLRPSGRHCGVGSV
jgi:hypothetical protein